MSVTLRKKPIANGRFSYYLDYYSAGERKYETLRLYTVKKPLTDEDRENNRQTIRLAESIRSKREIQINTTEHGFEPLFKQNINFYEYFKLFADNYNKADKRLVIASLKQFQNFIGKNSIKPKEVTEQLCIDFKEFLKKKFNGETPHNYFSKFKKMLIQATREKIIPVNPAANVINSRSSGVMKDILDFEELQKLAKTPCGNSEVKRAFLFACYSGIRYCDIKELTWRNINSNSLQFTQSKTSRPVTINLSKTALILLGKKQEPHINLFNLPSHTGISKSLKTWAEKAGLNKHVTFHCARHSFATNLLIHETDVKTVSSLLGHTNLEQTQKYVRVVEALKEKAINRLPELIF